MKRTKALHKNSNNSHNDTFKIPGTTSPFLVSLLINLHKQKQSVAVDSHNRDVRSFNVETAKCVE